MNTTPITSAETPATSRVGTQVRVWNWVCTVFAHRLFPIALAAGAVILMLPSLGAGLFMDDLVQRTIQLKPEQLPTEIQYTGFGSAESGTFTAVLNDLFGLSRRKEALELGKDYGLLTWWMPEDLKAALWRPFTAFTHWLDYRLFPEAPALMHAHNIAWFTVVVYLAAVVYRRIAVHGSEVGVVSDEMHARALGVGGLAAFLFLLDKNMFFPVMFVANRGFVIALCWGLLCLYEHHLWRTTRSLWHLAGTTLSLALAMLANEGGASTLAFLLAYALVLEPQNWRMRAVSLLPAIGVMVAWRVVYVWLGFGVANIGGYIDPGYEPLVFLNEVFTRATILAGAQLSGVPPEVTFFLNPAWKPWLTTAFLLFSLTCATVFSQMLRRDRSARFWFLAMLLSLVPAATVVPLSKNLGFVAVGTFGVIAPFLVRLISNGSDERAPKSAGFVAGCVAVLLLMAHVPGSLVARALLAWICPKVSPITTRMTGFRRFPGIGGRDVIMVNCPAQLATLAAPFVRAYYSEPLPMSFATLLPAQTSFTLTRVSDSTLIAEAITRAPGKGLLSCDEMGLVHPCYALQAANTILTAGRTWKVGQRVERKTFVTEVMEITETGAPRKVAFHFHTALDSEQMFWLHFNWGTLKYEKFKVPKVGEGATIAGPQQRSRRLNRARRTAHGRHRHNLRFVACLLRAGPGDFCRLEKPLLIAPNFRSIRP